MHLPFIFKVRIVRPAAHRLVGSLNLDYEMQTRHSVLLSV